jgi:hypothetical protein
MKISIRNISWIIACCLIPALKNGVYAQCSGSTPATILTFDTVGTGTGNDIYFFRLPKFNPAVGTLISATINSAVTVNYAYSIGNTRALGALYRTRILRTDDINSTALDPNPISQATQTPNLNTVVPGNSTVQIGPLTLNYTVNSIVNDGRLVNFMGNDSLNFEYDNTSFVAFSGPSGSNVDFTQLNDTLLFQVSYAYCPTIILPANLFSFNLKKKDNNTVTLNWQQLDENAGRSYYLQTGRNGKDFTDFATIAANSTGNYTYDYALQHELSGQLYFRIKVLDANGSASYAPTRVINLNDLPNGGMHISPANPDNFMKIDFNTSSDRKISVFTMAGQQVWTGNFINTSSCNISFTTPLNKGVYIVESVDNHTQERSLARVMAQ